MRYLLCVLMLPGLLLAQNISCSVSGSVQDPTGAVVAGVGVTLTVENKGFVRTATTNNDGFFSFPDLSPDTFVLALNAVGFKAYRQSGIVVGSSEQRSLGIIRLQLGEVSDTVSVVADAVAVNTISGEKSGALSGGELDNLALRSRDPFDAVSLMPGVVDVSDGRDAPSVTSARNIYIAGGRNESKNITIDGISSTDSGSADVVYTMPSMDAIAEMKLLTSNFAAEYGRNSGGTLTFITKGGTKVFHGSGNWYYRHENLIANNYFNNLAGRDRSPYRYNIAGYTIGGPIPIRPINPDRNRLFFFFSQEFQHQLVQWGTKTITVPTVAERAGDFSRSMDVNGRLIPVQDPLNGKQQFPGNVVPASRFNASGQAILKMLPLPNYTDPNPSRIYQWNYFNSESGAYPRRTEVVRVDYSPRPNWQMYVRVSNVDDERHAPYGIWGTGSVNYNLTNIISRAPGRGVTVHSTNTLSPSVVNEFILGYTRNSITHNPEDPDRINRQKLGILIPQRNPANNPLNIIPNMTFGGIANPVNLTMGDPMPNSLWNPLYSLVENLSKTWGTHTFKVGVYIERMRLWQKSGAPGRGTITFDRDTLNNLDSNNAFANALMGNYDQYYEATTVPEGSVRTNNNEWYVQDTWRVSRRLSLDYGVRFYHDPPQFDARKQVSAFSTYLYDPKKAPALLRPGFNTAGSRVAVDPRNGTTYPAGLIGTFAPGSGDPANGMYLGGKDGYPAGLYKLPAVAAAPRLGFAFAPTRDGRLAIRGGVGVFFDRTPANITLNALSNPPTVYTPTQYYGTIAGIQEQVSSSVLSPTGTVYSLASAGKLATTYNYSLSVQKQLSSTLVSEVSYVGSVTRHQPWLRNLNPVPLGSNFLAVHPENRDPTSTNSVLSANFLRSYQGHGNILLTEFAGTSSYNSLQASLSQRLRHGISAGVAYTFSKSLSTADSYSTQVDAFLSPRDRNYGPSSFDRSHNFTARYTWALPKVPNGVRFRPVQWVANGWELSGVMRMLSGAPITPGYSLVVGVDYSGSASASVRPNVGNPSAPLLERFAAPSFPAPNVPTLGNVGKGILRGPGVNNWDVSLYKRIRIVERVSTQLRLETYNTFNHTQFSGVDSTLRFDARGAQINTLFMQPTSARPPRRVQLALRLNW